MKLFKIILVVFTILVLCYCDLFREKPIIDKEVPIYHEFSDDVSPCTVFAYLNLDAYTYDAGWYITYDSEKRGAQEIRYIQTSKVLHKKMDITILWL